MENDKQQNSSYISYLVVVFYFNLNRTQNSKKKHYYQSIISGYDIDNIGNMAWQSAEIYPSRLDVNDVSTKSLGKQW